MGVLNEVDHLRPTLLAGLGDVWLEDAQTPAALLSELSKKAIYPLPEAQSVA